MARSDKNIAILERKIIYFCLRSNFRERTTLNSSINFTELFFSVYKYLKAFWVLLVYLQFPNKEFFQLLSLYKIRILLKNIVYSSLEKCVTYIFWSFFVKVKKQLSYLWWRRLTSFRILKWNAVAHHYSLSQYSCHLLLSLHFIPFF